MKFSYMFQMIPIEHWTPTYSDPALGTGDHRVLCAEEHNIFLNNFPEQPELGVSCGKCGGVLRLWTDQHMNEQLKDNDKFVCNNCHPDLEQGWGNPFCEEVNTEDNRYNCFKCDFDLCKKCVHEIAKKAGKEAVCSVNIDRHPILNVI